MVKRATKRLNAPPPPVEWQFKPGSERAREMGRKGGKSKGIWALVKMRKKCSKRCPIYDRCPFAYYAQRTEGKPCLLNRMADQEAKAIVKVAERAEASVDEAIFSILGLIMRDVLVKHQEDIKLKRKLLYDLMNVRKTVFGEKKDVEVKADVAVDMEAILKKIKAAMEGGNDA